MLALAKYNIVSVYEIPHHHKRGGIASENLKALKKDEIVIVADVVDNKGHFINKKALAQTWNQCAFEAFVIGRMCVGWVYTQNLSIL